MGKLKKVKLGELGDIVTGNTPSKKIKEFYNSKDIPFIKPDDLDEHSIKSLISSKEFISNSAETKARILGKGSVLFTCIGIIGKVGIIGCDKMAFNQQINAIMPNDKVDSRYLAYCLYHNKNRIKDIANAPVVPIINKTQFKQIEILIEIDLQTQHKIADVLDKVQSLIDKRKNQIKECDRLIESLFYDMFGNPFKKQIGFKWNKLGEVVEINPKKKEIINRDFSKKISFVPMENVGVNGEIETIQTRTIGEVYKGFTYFREGDVLFAKITPCMENGKGAIAKGLCNGIGFGSTEFHVLRPIKDKSTSNWIFRLTKLGKFRKCAETKMTGSAGQKRVPVSFLKEVYISIPPTELQNEFAEKVEKIEHQKQLLEKSLSLMEDNSNSLMQKAFKGELFS